MPPCFRTDLDDPATTAPGPVGEPRHARAAPDTANGTATTAGAPGRAPWAGPTGIAPGTTLTIARHGRSELNHSRRVTGRLDPALAAEGHEQAQALALCVQPGGLDAIYASALRRTAQTAAPAAQATGLPVHRLAALDEVGMGTLEGRWRDERDPQAQALWAQWQAQPWHVAVPGGEPFADFTRRVQTALHTILQQHPGQRVLIVGHGATNRVLLGTLLGWPQASWPGIRPRNSRCYRLCWREAGQEPDVLTFTLGGPRSGRSEPGFVV